jgi:multiple sugar transport system substrate-binding protein
MRVREEKTMNMKVKALFASFLLVVLGLAAAQSIKQPDYSQFQPEPGKYTLTVWSWVPGLDKTVQGFEKAYPNITVKVVNFGGSSDTYQKLRTAIKAGSGAPDVAQIEYDVLPSFITTGALADLTQYGADKVKDFFVPWTWGQVSPDGQHVFGIPQDTGPLAMVYNKAIFDKYNLKVPKTWDEYAAEAAKLNQASSGQVKMGNFYADTGAWFMGMVWAAGGHFFSLDGNTWSQTLNSETAQKVLSYWNNLIQKGYVSTFNPFSTDYWHAAGSGKIAASMEAAWMPGSYAGTLKDQTAGDWRAEPLPQWGSSYVSGNWGGSSDAVLKSSQHPKAATLFTIWLNTNAQAMGDDWTNGGLFPADAAGLKLPVLHNSSTEPNKFFGGQDLAKVYSEASKAVNVNFLWAPWINFVLNNFAKQFNAMVNGKMTPAQALDAWQQDSLKYAQQQGFTVKGQ